MVINIEILYRNIKMHMEVKAVLLNDTDSIHTWLIHIVYMSFLHDAIFNVSLMCVFMEHDVRLYHSWTFTSKVICLQNGAKKKKKLLWDFTKRYQQGCRRTVLTV